MLRLSCIFGQHKRTAWIDYYLASGGSRKLRVVRCFFCRKLLDVVVIADWGHHVQK